MNLVHLKYAVEIAETNSITKAAERLYTAQPNLSRAIRELENTLGITIFTRTSKGIYPTPQGEEFLGYARKVLSQVDQLEAMYRHGGKATQQFSISVPRASYISCAFTQFVKSLPFSPGAEIFYKETNALRAINNILEADYRLGILRYQMAYESKFQDLLQEKSLFSEPVYQFSYVLLLSAQHPLATKARICREDLVPYVEIAHADPYVPSMPLSTARKNELMDNVNQHIYVFERGSQLDLLSQCPHTFMWVSPVPQRLLDRFNLVQRSCEEDCRIYNDVLIYKKEYTLSKLDRSFIEELTREKDALR